ncbi:ester cyclase [Bacillus sp. SD088]|uniref:ester cyclase n=1 Tax=Bacillus sp. SD088 TaxID=2782012 RepID=UPI001A9787E7|nr:ester cyclase [Bacillus sp. SD088]MBO0993552.1 ester cyclase [Bacillus sp. SD088]
MNGKSIYKVWVKAWNEDINVLDEIVDENCIVHQARTDGKDSKNKQGVEAMKDVIISSISFFDNIRMSLVVGPIEEDNYVSARWLFNGKYNGQMAGANAEKGKEISFEGTDIFQIRNGKIVDYWVSSDVVDFMNQLGMS